MGLIPSRDSSPSFEAFVEQLPDLQGKVVAITGSTTGLGYVFAQTCVKRDAATVLLLNRPSERAKTAKESLRAIAKSTHVETIECDLQDFKSVRKAASQMKEKYEALDILCNNAGIMAVPDDATVDGYDVQVQTNYLSHFLLTKELMPLLKKAQELRGEARVVNQLSLMRIIPYTNLKKEFLEQKGGTLGGSGYIASWGRYHQSKLAHSVFACALWDRLKGTGIKVTMAAPGYASTNIQSTTPGFTGLRWSRILARSAEEGCMPLLSAGFRPVHDADDAPKIWEPGRLRLYGPPVEFELEETSTKKEFKDMLWTASEEACGSFNPC
jgi:NAD(P)-dependent dehydrogenase (short-subunit alcohol dehydrogenase family)